MPLEPPPEKIQCRTLWGGIRSYPASRIRFRPSVYGVAVNQGKVLLGTSAFTGRLDIPGGAVEPWETLEQALRREFREETGVEPQPLEMFHFSESFFAFFDHPFHSLRFYFLVDVPPDVPLKPQRSEISDLRWLDPLGQPEEVFAPGDRDILKKALARAMDRARCQPQA